MTSYRCVAVGVVLFSLAAHAALPTTAPAVAPNARLGAIRASGMPLDDLIDQLRDLSQQNVFVNWRALDKAGIRRDLPVTIDLAGLSLDGAIDKLLKEVGGARVVLGRQLDDGVTVISTAEDLALSVETRSYDVRSLLAGEDTGRAGRLEAVIRRVQGIDPLSWKANGGTVGSVREVGGQLIITHGTAVHRRVAEELHLPYIEATPAAAPAPATRPADAAARVAAKTALDRMVPALQFDHVRLADAMSFFGDAAGVTLDVQWDELAKAGIGRDSEVLTRMRNVKFRNALKAVLATIDKTGNGAATDTAVWAVLESGHVVVTTRQDLAARFTTQVRYSAKDLLARGTDAATQKQIKADFRDLIVETIATDTWASAAGTPGGRAVWDGDDLVVSQTVDVQADVAELIRKLREQRSAVGH